MLCRFLLLEVEVERLVEGEDGRGWLMAGEGDADGNDDMVNHIIFYESKNLNKRKKSVSLVY